jgi:hypothetical protein
VRGILQNLLLATLPSLLVLALLLELALRTVVPAAELPTAYFDANHRILRYDTEGPREGLFTRGPLAQLRARWRINDQGWSSAVDYTRPDRRPHPLIAIVGDSYVEAFHVDADRSLAAELRRRLVGRAEVYSFGMSGAPLSQYLHMARYAATEFAADALVVNVVHNDFHESLLRLARKPGYLQLVEDGEGRLREQEPLAAAGPRRRGSLQASALARYWRVTLRSLPMSALLSRLRGRPLPIYNANAPVELLEANHQLIRDATFMLVERIRDAQPDGRVLFMMDPPRYDLYQGTLATSSVVWLNRLLEEACARVGIPFLDLAERFEAVYRETGVRFESEVDSHWNEEGHAQAAAALYERLVELSWVAGR